MYGLQLQVLEQILYIFMPPITSLKDKNINGIYFTGLLVRSMNYTKDLRKYTPKILTNIVINTEYLVPIRKCCLSQFQTPRVGGQGCLDY
jgi:hypothetical protein